MPKVTDEYLADKRSYILKCTDEILTKKPLYAITMQDIIKKAGFSHGIIYHYYANLDEIYVDYINKNTTCNSLEQSMDALLSSKRPEKEIFYECIIAIGRYIEELLKSVGGRTCFEFTVLYAYDVEKRATVFPRLKFKQSLAYAQNRMVEYILSNVEKGVFHPQTPIHTLIMFAGSLIDGIAQSMATGAAEGDDPSLDIPAMFEILARSMLGLMEVQ